MAISTITEADNVTPILVGITCAYRWSKKGMRGRLKLITTTTAEISCIMD